MDFLSFLNRSRPVYFFAFLDKSGMVDFFAFLGSYEPLYLFAFLDMPGLANFFSFLDISGALDSFRIFWKGLEL